MNLKDYLLEYIDRRLQNYCPMQTKFAYEDIKFLILRWQKELDKKEQQTE